MGKCGTPTPLHDMHPYIYIKLHAKTHGWLLREK